MATNYRDSNTLPLKLEPMRFADEPPRTKRNIWKWLLISLATLSILFLTIFTFFNFHPARITSSDPSLNVYNETFGFGEIILISLPERTDRQDAISLLSSSSGVRVTKIIQAVHGEEVSDKALPFSKDVAMNMPHLGSWRSHLNAFRYIVDNKIESALVFEDDVDWDVQIKDELHSLSFAMRTSAIRPALTLHERLTAPYGLDWDLLYFGPSYYESPPPPHDTLGTAYPDPYRSPSNDNSQGKWYNWATTMALTTNSSLTHRVIVPTYGPLGLVAIGVTYEGARRLLYEFSWSELQYSSTDYVLENAHKEGKLQGWTVLPPLMSSWKIGGPGDSDLQTVGQQGARPSNENGRSVGLESSKRKALKREFEERPGGWSEERFKGRGEL